MSTPNQYNHHPSSLLDLPNELLHEIISHCIGDIDTLLQIPEIKSRLSNYVTYISNTSEYKNQSCDAVIAKFSEKSANGIVDSLQRLPANVSLYLLYEHTDNLTNFEVTEPVLEQLCRFKNVSVKVGHRSELSELNFTQMVRYLGLSKSTRIDLQDCFDTDICEEGGFYPWIYAVRSSYSDPGLLEYLLKTCPNMVRCEVLDGVDTSGDYTSFQLSNIRHDKLQYLHLSDLAKAESLDFPLLEELSVSFPISMNQEFPEPSGIYKVSCPNLKSLTLTFHGKSPLVEDFNIGQLDEVSIRGFYIKGQQQPSAKTMDFFSRFKTVTSGGELSCLLTIKDLFVNCETLYVEEAEEVEVSVDEFDKADDAFPNVRNLIFFNLYNLDGAMLSGGGYPRLESLHLHLDCMSGSFDSHWAKLIRSVKHLTLTVANRGFVTQETLITEHYEDMRGSSGDSCLQKLTFEGFDFNPVPLLSLVYNLSQVHSLSFIKFQQHKDLRIQGTQTPNLSTLMCEGSQAGSTPSYLHVQSLEKLTHLKTSHVSQIYIERCHNIQTIKTFKPNDHFGILRLHADSLPHLRQLSYIKQFGSEHNTINIPDLHCDVDVQSKIYRPHKRKFENDW
ncbi:hypothetical protein WICPIJ_009469 [Wickerhamomyces pijperi]|uniref:Uncharacterized protein n=1 Tax=Wickerhamomyces pijperi TaxID=599730 RepID=A0A9P8TDW5_WICPI|nr:hypothetical protein WICPIJ_009469 [Wickerhamomyces pijperi]